jgi:transcriptional regulator with XRE-family HTH domain
MSSPQLPNHLRANRKRLGLSQEEVAQLLGAESGAKVCRYERFVREPSLQTALAYEAVFKKPASELFPGLYQKIEQEVAARARALARKTEGRKSKRQTARKHETLKEIATTKSKKHHKES